MLVAGSERDEAVEAVESPLRMIGAPDRFPGQLRGILSSNSTARSPVVDVVAVKDLPARPPSPAATFLAWPRP